MTAVIKPSTLCGSVSAPPSKSMGHRSLICAALSDRKVTIKNCGDSNDIAATISTLKALGSTVTVNKNDVTVTPALRNCENVILDCGESGSTARFMLPIAAALGVKNATFIGKGRLPLRPFGVLCDALRQNGIVCSSDTLPITISGKLRSGSFKLPGNISSQYISGLLFALSIIPGDSEIILTSPLESSGYVDMTIAELKSFGAKVQETSTGYKISGKTALTGINRTVEGDWSGAAFFLSAGAVLGDITVNGLNLNSLQGDKKIIDLLKQFGATVLCSDNSVRVIKNTLEAISIDASQIPDLVPILAVTAAFADGTTVIHHAERLRLKESDRLKETVTRLKAFGIKAEETSDGMTVTGGVIASANITAENDHRLAMAFSVLASGGNGNSQISQSEAINKSYPEFFKDFKKTGGKADVI